jgi:hypothetical protein
MFVCLFILLFSSVCSVPVVFVTFGALPLYLKLNIELVSRKNHVIVLTDLDFHGFSNDYDAFNRTVVYENLLDYQVSSDRFKPLYRHISRDRSGARTTYESRCILRWFILKDYMEAKGLRQVHFFCSSFSLKTGIY